MLPFLTHPLHTLSFSLQTCSGRAWPEASQTVQLLLISSAASSLFLAMLSLTWALPHAHFASLMR